MMDGGRRGVFGMTLKASLDPLTTYQWDIAGNAIIY